jgi:phage baseplate assembly protein W
MLDNSFIGKSIKFPLEIDSNGSVVLTQGVDTIEQSISNILSWDRPRFFLNPFYCKVEEVLEEPNTTVAHQLIRRYVIDSITEWDKRLELTAVEIVSDDGVVVNVQIQYKIKESQLENTMVYPFYKITE